MIVRVFVIASYTELATDGVAEAVQLFAPVAKPTLVCVTKPQLDSFTGAGVGTEVGLCVGTGVRISGGGGGVIGGDTVGIDVGGEVGAGVAVRLFSVGVVSAITCTTGKDERTTPEVDTPLAWSAATSGEEPVVALVAVATQSASATCWPEGPSVPLLPPSPFDALSARPRISNVTMTLPPKRLTSERREPELAIPVMWMESAGTRSVEERALEKAD